MKDLFDRISAKSHDTDFSLTVSYLEIYNETIRDLLAPESGPLALRESNGVATPAGLSSKEPSSANDVVDWIMLGNGNRTVNATEANATSSRSHAVLTVTVTQKARGGGLTEKSTSASLSVIDLAGSERASVTKNKGDRLIEGANINRSLLALGNCINALCDPRKRAHVPYRDSKLTRLLKQSLGGNCKTVMIVCVSPASSHYDETHNTLQYANRAKEIKTKAIRNVVSVDRHVQDYCRAIAALQKQVAEGEEMFAARSAKMISTARDEEKREVDGAVRKLKSSWDNVYSLSVRSERGKVEKGVIDGVITVLKKWRSTAFADVTNEEATSSSTFTSDQVISQADELIASLTNSSRACSADFPHSSVDMYNNLRDSIASKLTGSMAERFQLELKVLELETEAARSQARAEGLAEGMRVQARALSAITEGQGKVEEALEAERQRFGPGEIPLRKLREGIDKANKEAFLAFTVGSNFDNLSSAQPTTTRMKRTAGTRSPPTESVAKYSRSHLVPASPHRLSTTFARRSPRKSVLRGPASKKKLLGVQWRDDAGEALVESTNTPPSRTSIGEPSGSTTKSWLGPAQIIPDSAKRIAPLRGKASMPSLRTLPSLSEESPPFVHQPFSFAQEEDHHAAAFRPIRSASTYSDVGNSSVSSNGSDYGGPAHSSMASTSSGLFMPLVSRPSSPGRNSGRSSTRDSTIGPARSSKATRRLSNSNPLEVPAIRKAQRGTPILGAQTPTVYTAQRSPKKKPSLNFSAPTAASISNSISATSTWAPNADSLARIAARRESTAPSLSRMASRDSLAGGKGGVWR